MRKIYGTLVALVVCFHRMDAKKMHVQLCKANVYFRNESAFAKKLLMQIIIFDSQGNQAAAINAILLSAIRY